MLKIAVPNKGSLADAAVEILKEAGYRQRVDSRDLVLSDPENGVEFYYLRPRDIALYVGTGELEAGITGRDLLIDSGADAKEILSLDFGGSTFRFAGPAAKSWKVEDLSGKRVATAYPGLVENGDLEILLRRLQGVVTARQYVLLDYDIPKISVDKACAVTPGLESPTISPLQKPDWVAVRAMVLRRDTNRLMDELWAIGARGILVTDIHACRL